MNNVDFYSVTPNQYSSLETKDNNALYFLNNGEIYKGETLLSNNVKIVADGEDYPETGENNKLYAKLNGESAFWNGSSYTLISRSIIAELQLLENRIDVSINSIFNVNKLIDRTITEINSEDIMSVGSYAFKDCTGLTSINLPNVTNIGSSAFQDCIGLSRVDLHKVESIGREAFSNCWNLTTLIIRSSTVPTLAYSESDSDAAAFISTAISNQNYGDGYIYVLDNLVNSYKTATNWSVYADRIKGISELPNDGGE